MEEGANGRSSKHKRQERRRHRRIRRQFIVRFQIRSHQGGGRSSADWNMVTVQDLGPEGVFFNYDREIDIGTLINLRINFPQSRTPINCVARIVRVERPPFPPISRIAAAFVEIGEKEKDLVKIAAEEFYFRKSRHFKP